VRALITASCAIIGLFAGAAVDALAGSPEDLGPWVGLAVGLLGGWRLARQTYPPRPRPPSDPSRYPNRVVRRDRRREP
jgi:hypothetical protein